MSSKREHFAFYGPRVYYTTQDLSWFYTIETVCILVPLLYSRHSGNVIIKAGWRRAKPGRETKTFLSQIPLVTHWLTAILVPCWLFFQLQTHFDRCISNTCERRKTKTLLILGHIRIPGIGTTILGGSWDIDSLFPQGEGVGSSRFKCDKRKIVFVSLWSKGFLATVREQKGKEICLLTLS